MANKQMTDIEVIKSFLIGNKAKNKTLISKDDKLMYFGTCISQIEEDKNGKILYINTTDYDEEIKKIQDMITNLLYNDRYPYFVLDIDDVDIFSKSLI